METSYLIAIDPGTKILGLAVAKFQVNSTNNKSASIMLHRAVKPLGKGSTVKPRGSNKALWDERMVNIVKQVDSILSKTRTDVGEVQALIELPTRYFSDKGEAANNSDATIKLAVMVGMLSQLFEGHSIAYSYITAPDWKGSVPKDVTQRRILRAWGINCKDNNEADAIGMIDWYVRRYLVKRGIQCDIIRHEDIETLTRKPKPYKSNAKYGWPAML